MRSTQGLKIQILLSPIFLYRIKDRLCIPLYKTLKNNDKVEKSRLAVAFHIITCRGQQRA